MKSKGKVFYHLDKKSGIEFHVLEDLRKTKYKPESIFLTNIVLIFIMIIAATANMFSLFQMMTSFLYDDPQIVKLTVAILILIFDGITIYMAITQRKLEQGYNDVSPSHIYLCLGLVITAFLITMTLRFVTADSVFSATQPTAMYSTVSQDTTPNYSTLYSLLLGCFPLLSSGVSYFASYMISNPLKNEAKNAELVLIANKHYINQLNAACDEYNLDFDERILDNDNKKLASTICTIEAMKIEYQDLTRILLAGYLGNPEVTTMLIETRPNTVKLMSLPDVSTIKI